MPNFMGVWIEWIFLMLWNSDSIGNDGSQCKIIWMRINIGMIIPFIPHFIMPINRGEFSINWVSSDLKNNQKPNFIKLQTEANWNNRTVNQNNQIVKTFVHNWLP